MLLFMNITVHHTGECVNGLSSLKMVFREWMLPLGQTRLFMLSHRRTVPLLTGSHVKTDAWKWKELLRSWIWTFDLFTILHKKSLDSTNSVRDGYQESHWLHKATACWRCSLLMKLKGMFYAAWWQEMGHGSVTFSLKVMAACKLTETKKITTTLTTGKLMLTAFWDKNWIILEIYMEKNDSY